jgi:rhodanese-related sulfurtransferase
MDRYIEFASAHASLTALAAVLIAAIVATEGKRMLRRWRELSSAELTQLVNDGALLLDLRDGEAHRAGHIAGARLVTLAELDGAVANKPKDAQVVAYCESGNDSAKAADRLVAAGFTNVGSLRGGIATWRADNLPLVAGGK